MRAQPAAGVLISIGPLWLWRIDDALDAANLTIAVDLDGLLATMNVFDVSCLCRLSLTQRLQLSTLTAH